MRTYLIPALCALALFATPTLSHAADADESTAEAVMDRNTTVVTDAWQDDPSPVWY